MILNSRTGPASMSKFPNSARAGQEKHALETVLTGLTAAATGRMQSNYAELAKSARPANAKNRKLQKNAMGKRKAAGFSRHAEKENAAISLIFSAGEQRYL